MNLQALLVAVLVSGSLAGIIFLVGYVAPYWTWIKGLGVETYSGLWQWCRTMDSHSGKCGVLFPDGHWPGWLTACQGVLSASLFSALLSMITAVVWSFRGPSKATCIICSLLFLISALLSLIGACLYGAEERENLSWAFAFPLIAAFLYIIPALLSAMAARESGKHPPEK